jgi:hypothetical protein
MRLTVCAFTVATLICAAGYETSHAASIAPLTGIQAGTGSVTLVYSHHYRHPYRIVVPLTRNYGYQPYWWPQGQYHWSPYGLERWGYWCEPVSYHRLGCGVGNRD